MSFGGGSAPARRQMLFHSPVFTKNNRDNKKPDLLWHRETASGTTDNPLLGLPFQESKPVDKKGKSRSQTLGQSKSATTKVPRKVWKTNPLGSARRRMLISKLLIGQRVPRREKGATWRGPAFLATLRSGNVTVHPRSTLYSPFYLYLHGCKRPFASCLRPVCKYLQRCLQTGSPPVFFSTFFRRLLTRFALAGESTSQVSACIPSVNICLHL